MSAADAPGRHARLPLLNPDGTTSHPTRLTNNVSQVAGYLPPAGEEANGKSNVQIRPLTFALLRRLADGEFHSGEALAQQLGVTRTTVHNALQDAANLGLTLYSVRGRGYRLARPLQWLDAGLIRAQLGAARSDLHIEILDHAASSNALLLQHWRPRA